MTIFSGRESRTSRAKILAFVFMLQCGWSGASLESARAADLIIASDSQPRAEIVVADDSPRMTHLAAKELQHYVERISGAKLPIVASPTSGRAAILVGRSVHTDKLGVDATELKHGAFRIVARDNRLALFGNDADFSPPAPHARNNGDIPRATAEWDKLTGATWGFPHVQVYKCWHPKLDIWEQDERGSFNAACEVAEILKVEGKLAEARAELERIDERGMTIESYRQLLRRTRDTLKKAEDE